MTSHLVTQESAVAFAAATGSAWVPENGGTPWLYGVVPMRPAVVEALAAAIPPGLGDTVPILHGEHLVRCHAPLRMGSRLRSRASHLATEAKASGTTVTLGVALHDEDGGLLEEHELTVFLPGAQLEPFGSRTPLVGEDLGDAFDAERHVPTDLDQSRRYADVSGDRTVFHIDDEAARHYGFPGVIMHGLCTLAVATNALAPQVGGAAVQVSVRFSAPGLPGDDVALRHRSVDAATLLFEARSPQGTLTLSRGRLSSREA